MKGWMKRILALIMTMAMMTSMITVPAEASEEQKENVEVSDADYADFYQITDVTIEGNAAVVSYESTESAILVVAIYTEDGLMLCNSAKATVSPLQKQATLVFQTELPEHFFVSAFLMDIYDQSPLCQSYETDVYTQSVMAAGTHGNNLKWKLYEGGQLVIYGKGDMLTVTEKEYPWYAYKNEITGVQITDSVTSLADRAFYNYPKMTNIDMGNGIRSIGAYGISNCYALTDVTIPVDCEWTNQSFYNCSNITAIHYTYGQTGVMKDSSNNNSGRYYVYSLPYISRSKLVAVTFEEGITYIGNYAFYGAVALTGVSLPSTLKTIGNYAFGQTEKMASMDLPEGLTTLGEGCFFRSGIQTIQFPASMNSIPDRCFESSKLTGIQIPKNIAAVGKYAFVNCHFVKELIIEDGVEVLLGTSFYNCTGLTSVTMPVDCDWKSQDFYGCSNVKELHYTYGKTGVMLDGAGTNSGRYCMFALPYYAAYSLEVVTFEEGITYIGDYALYGAKSLKLVEIPSTVKVIGDFAFYDTKALQTIQIPEGVMELGTYCFGRSGILTIGWPSTLTVIPDRCFEASEIQKVHIPEFVTNIGKYAFANCYKLTEVDLGDGVRVLEGHSFYNCTALTSVTMSVDCDWKSQDFYGCSNVKELHYTYGQTGVMLDGAGTNSGRYYMFALPYYARNSLETITFEDGITYIGDYAVYGASKLKNIHIPNTVEEIGDYAFYGTTALTSITLPQSVKNLGTSCFARSGLLSIEFPTSITKIPDRCFEASAIEKIVVPDHMKEIGKYAFSNCYQLTEVVLKNGVRKVDNNAFYNCTGLTTITMPVDCDIKSHAFYGCSNVEALHYTYGQSGVMMDATTSGDKNYMMALPYYAKNSLKSITFEEGITYIGKYAFPSLNALESITFPSTLHTVADFAFFYDTSLKEIYFTGDAPQIGKNAFSKVTATAYYPANNNSWLGAQFDSHGGDLTWEEYEEPVVEAYTMAEEPEPLEAPAPVEITEVVENLIPNEPYIFLVVADSNATELLAENNLIYINQAKADANGTVTFQYMERGDAKESHTYISGATAQNLTNAVISLPNMHETGYNQEIHPTVTYEGKVLVEGKDYVVFGSTIYNKEGSYTCYFRGIREYTGLIACTYQVYELIGVTTLSFIVPKTVTSPKCWNDGVYIGYSDDYRLDTFTKFELTATTRYLTPDLKTDRLMEGTYGMYVITLSKEQAEAINQATFVAIMNKSNTYRTYISGKGNILKAPVGSYADTYNTAKTKVEDLDGYTFIMNGEVDLGTSIQGFGSYTGYWTKCVDIQAVLPSSSIWKNCWNQGVYLAYSNSYLANDFTKIKMTRSSTYVDVESQTDQLLSGTYAVYTVSLTEDEVKAIDASTYVVFMNAGNAYRTYINGKYNVFKAVTDTYSETYSTTKASVKDRANNTFVLCGGLDTNTSIEGYGTFTGYWMTKELVIVESTATINAVFAAPAKNLNAFKDGIYLAYGNSGSASDLTYIEMDKTTETYTPDILSDALVEGEYEVYTITLTSAQIEAINSSKNVVFASGNGTYRTLLAPAYNVLKAASGSYSATYSTANFVVEDHNGETFVVCDSKVTGSTTDGYGMFLGYWDLGEQ